MERNERKVREGVVVSDKMDKTVVVVEETMKLHKLYKKRVKFSKRYKAHDENNECNKAYGCNLVFDNQNSSHQFLKGIVNDSQTIVNYVWRITQPDNWWDFSWQGWGDFSVPKYCYIMDVLGCTFDKIRSDDDSNSALQKVIAAYKEYKKTHAPIVDDKGNDIFPEEAQDK